MTRIVIIDGHPDPDTSRFVHALADAYAESAASAGHEVRRVVVASLDFPLIRSQEEWKNTPAPSDVLTAQEAVVWAEHVVFAYPLWLGDLPALFKGFLEQFGRPDFAFRYTDKGLPQKLLSGRSARVIVTMGMPAFWYVWVYRLHSLKSFERNILKFVGFRPVRHTIIGMVEGPPAYRMKWLEKVKRLGRAAA